MKEYIEERAVAIANYIIDHNATVRQTAKKFGISKSTVHKDVTDRLEHINPGLAADVYKRQLHKHWIHQQNINAGLTQDCAEPTYDVYLWVST